MSVKKQSHPAAYYENRFITEIKLYTIRGGVIKVKLQKDNLEKEVLKYQAS